MPKGTGLLWRALRASDKSQGDFAAHEMDVSRRTLTRMLNGSRPLKERELLKVRDILAKYKETK